MVAAVQDTLKLQASRVMDSGVLNEDRCERLGRAMLELEIALEDINKEPGVAGSVRGVRDRHNGLVDDMVEQILHPEMSF